MGKSEEASTSYDRSIELYQQAHYLPGEQWAAFNQGCVYLDSGKWHLALPLFQKSITLGHRTGEVRRRAAALNNKGEILRRQGNLEQAITAYQEAQQILEELGFEEFVGIARMNLGISYLKKAALSDAASHLEQSLLIFQRLDANVHMPEILRYLAELELLKKQATNAQKIAEDAVGWAVKLERGQEEGQARRALGQAYRELGQLNKAEAHLHDSLTILEKRSNPYEIGLTLVELTRLRHAQANASQNHAIQHQEAIQYCDRAIAIFDELGAALDLEQAQQIKQSL